MPTLDGLFSARRLDSSVTFFRRPCPIVGDGMGFEVLQIVDVVLGFLLMLAGGLMLWRPSGRLMWPRRKRHDPRSLRWRGVAPFIVGTGVATSELLILTGNAQATDYIFLPLTVAAAIVALATVWVRRRAARADEVHQLDSH